MLIDTHAHLMFEEFDDDREDVLRRAFESGVSKIVNIGCGEESSRQAVAMLSSFEGEGIPHLYATVGLHPYDAADLREELMLEWHELCSSDKRIVAIGETGLDYFKAAVDSEIQKKSFRRHLQLASELGLPVIVHNRDADEDCLNILREYPKVKAVFHCYGSSLEFAQKLWALGYYTSFTGIITFKNAEELRAVVEAVPLSSFMVETDCPYLAPQLYRGKRNEPAYVTEVAKMIAEVKGLDLEKVVSLSTKNAEDLLGLD